MYKSEPGEKNFTNMFVGASEISKVIFFQLLKTWIDLVNPQLTKGKRHCNRILLTATVNS